VSELFFSGLLIGVVVAAPIGPIGTATLLAAATGDYRAALGGMAGCILAELVLLIVAVAGAGSLGGYLASPPRIVPIGVGLALFALGLYYLMATHMPKLGGVTTFLFAFKITLLAPNNLAGLLALIVAMGLAGKLHSPAAAVSFMLGEFLGVTASWMALFGLGLRLRHNPTVSRAVPWLRRGVGAFMAIVGLLVVARI